MSCIGYGTQATDIYLNPSGQATNGLKNVQGTAKHAICPIIRSNGITSLEYADIKVSGSGTFVCTLRVSTLAGAATSYASDSIVLNWGTDGHTFTWAAGPGNIALPRRSHILVVLRRASVRRHRQLSRDDVVSSTESTGINMKSLAIKLGVVALFFALPHVASAQSCQSLCHPPTFAHTAMSALGLGSDEALVKRSTQMASAPEIRSRPGPSKPCASVSAGPPFLGMRLSVSDTK